MKPSSTLIYEKTNTFLVLNTIQPELCKWFANINRHRFSDYITKASPQEKACAEGAEVPYKLLLPQPVPEFKSSV